MTLKVVDFIKEYGLAKLKSEYNIRAKKQGNLVILNYDQIGSPKMDPIVMECRGLILELYTWEVVCRPMTRFFNKGEALAITDSFDWSDFVSFSKEDGSLIHLWEYKGEWRVSTRGSFADGACGESSETWAELVMPMLVNFVPVSGFTYMFEFCSEHNKIVRYYNENKLFWLTAVANDSGVEQLPDVLDSLAEIFKVARPDRFMHKNLEDVKHSLAYYAINDQSFEGFVLTDTHGMKLKMKSKTYVAFHHLRGESGSMFLIRNLTPFVISGETEEVLCYFPEVKDKLERVQKNFDALISDLEATLVITKDIIDQKEFALAVKDSPCNWILFIVRKTGTTIAELVQDNEVKIAKYLERL